MQTKLWKMNPVTKLSASVSLLRPSTFETSVRFYFPQLENLISKKSSDNDTNSSSDDLSRRADTYSNDDFMNGKFHTPEESDMEAEMESIESQFEDFYKQEYEREIHRNHHRRAHHGSHHGAAVGGSAVNNNMSSSSSPSSTPTGGKNSRTSPSVATGASARSSPTSVSNNNSNNNNNAMRSLFVAPNDTAMEMQLEADGGFDIKPFNMEEYVIPVQPRKGKRNVATAAAAVASGVIDVDEKVRD